MIYRHKGRLDDIRKISYFQALHRFLMIDGIDDGYITLLTTLFHKEYTWSIRMDETRAAYVKNAREGFLEKQNLDEKEKEDWRRSLDMPPSVLEVLLMLAKQMEDDFGDADQINIPAWFWMMISNLELSQYNDIITGTRESEKIIKILDIWLNREFDPDGHGSPFPLKNPRGDQRMVDLWMQANFYVVENNLTEEWFTLEEV